MASSAVCVQGLRAVHSPRERLPWKQSMSQAFVLTVSPLGACRSQHMPAGCSTACFGGRKHRRRFRSTGTWQKLGHNRRGGKGGEERLLRERRRGRTREGRKRETENETNRPPTALGRRPRLLRRSMGLSRRSAETAQPFCATAYPHLSSLVVFRYHACHWEARGTGQLTSNQAAPGNVPCHRTLAGPRLHVLGVVGQGE